MSGRYELYERFSKELDGQTILSSPLSLSYAAITAVGSSAC